MPSDRLEYSRDELLEHFPLRRASMLLFAAESQTAHSLLHSQRAMALYPTEQSVEEEETVFLDAMAHGRDLPALVHIQDIERAAHQWGRLVSPDAKLRAAFAHLLGQKYVFDYAHVPHIRLVLGLDEPEVQRAYEQHFGQPLSTIFAKRIALRERLTWFFDQMTKWLESLPPFWKAFSLTLTETVGAGILALPIAIASVGAIAGGVLLLVFGLVSILTITGLVEAIIRNGSIRYGSAYFGQLVTDYLGPMGGLLLRLSLVGLILLILTAYYIGVSTTIAAGTGIAPYFWVIPLFMMSFYFLWRESFSATIVFALIVGAVNIALILILSALALPYVRLDNLEYLQVPFVNGQPFDPSVLGLVFGVVLAAYFGHTSAVNISKVVLRDDPGGRALLRGNVAAMVTAVVLYIIWIVAVNGSVTPQVLATASGTALEPLAKIAGPSVHVFGTIFAVLSMGMGIIQFSLALFYKVREVLPVRAWHAPTGNVWILGKPRRFWLCLTPVILVTVFVEWLLVTGHQAFTRQIGFIGVIIVPILGGILPMMMLVASRLKGERIPTVVVRVVNNPIAVVLCLFFLSGILLHGLVIWQAPVERMIALFAVGIVIVALVVFKRTGVFATRTVVELCFDDSVEGHGTLNVVQAGKPLAVDVQVKYRSEPTMQQNVGDGLPPLSLLETVRVQLSALVTDELKVWVHRLTAEGDTSRLPAMLETSNGESSQQHPMGKTDDFVILPLTDQHALQVDISPEFMRKEWIGQSSA